MAQFKCLVSGTIANFEYEHDIAEMHKHPQYVFVETTKKVDNSLVKEKTVSVKTQSTKE